MSPPPQVASWNLCSLASLRSLGSNHDDWGFHFELPVWPARPTDSTQHQLHDVQENHPLHTQPSTGSQEARGSCASVPITPKAAGTSSQAASISFTVGVQQASDPLYPTPKS